MSTSDRLRVAASAIEGWTPAIVRKTAFLLFGIGVLVGVRGLVEALPLAGQIFVLLLVYPPLGLGIYLLSKQPEETLAPVRRHGLAQPFLFITGLWLAAIGWVAAFSLVLVEQGVVTFATQAGAAVKDTARLTDFYVWQSFEQIPALGVNDTLQWDVPLQYGGGAGVVVLAFKVLILLPLVPVFIAAWKVRSPPKPAAPPPPDPAASAP